MMPAAPATRRGILALAGLLAVAALGCGGKGDAKKARFPVTIAAAETRDVPNEIEATGTVEPLQTVAVTSQVGGVITSVAFHEGDEVRQGQMLFQVDPRPFQLDRDRAQAALSHDRAQAVDLVGQAERSQELFARNMVSPQDNDTKRAAADAIRATIRSDSAAVAEARLNVEFASIRSPIDGRTGNLQIHAGNLVKASDVGNPMVTVNKMRPILVRFSVPQDNLADILKQRGRKLTVMALPDTGDGKGSVGELTFVDNQVDAATGTVLLKAEFPNDDGALWPGAFVRVKLQVSEDAGATVVPAPAVSTGQSGSFVYVLNPDTTVALRPVQVGRTWSELAVIASGLRPGETVVTDGQSRLSPGARVSLRKPSRKEGEARP